MAVASYRAAEAAQPVATPACQEARRVTRPARPAALAAVSNNRDSGSRLTPDSCTRFRHIDMVMRSCGIGALCCAARITNTLREVPCASCSPPSRRRATSTRWSRSPARSPPPGHEVAFACAPAFCRGGGRRLPRFPAGLDWLEAETAGLPRAPRHRPRGGSGPAASWRTSSPARRRAAMAPDLLALARALAAGPGRARRYEFGGGRSRPSPSACPTPSSGPLLLPPRAGQRLVGAPLDALRAATACRPTPPWDAPRYLRLVPMTARPVRRTTRRPADGALPAAGPLRRAGRRRACPPGWRGLAVRPTSTPRSARCSITPAPALFARDPGGAARRGR